MLLVATLGAAGSTGPISGMFLCLVYLLRVDVAKLLEKFVQGEAHMIKKTCLVIGVAIALVSSPVVGAELDKKAKAEFCKEQAASIIKHIRATVGAWRDYSKATDDYDLAHQSKDKKLIAGAAKEQDRWREIHKIGLKHLEKYAEIWGAYCK